MPLTMRQHDANLHQPALCELLPIRDYLDSVLVRSNGALVAGYDLGGINSYYHSDETRNQTKYSLEALVRSLTERFSWTRTYSFLSKITKKALVSRSKQL